MRAHAALEVGPDGRGGARPLRMRSAPPLVLRWTYAGPLLVAGAGGPLGGDDLTLDVAVVAGARVRVGSAAATLVQPGRHPEPARVRYRAEVAAGAGLDWSPEPTVLVRGSVLHATTQLTCEEGARVRWREVTALGRRDEEPGSGLLRTDVVLGGRPLLRQETQLGPAAPSGWDGPAGTAGQRVLGTLLVVEPGLEALPAADASGWAVLPLDGPAALLTALGTTTLEVGRRLDAALAVVLAGAGAAVTAPA